MKFPFLVLFLLSTLACKANEIDSINSFNDLIQFRIKHWKLLQYYVGIGDSVQFKTGAYHFEKRDLDHNGLTDLILYGRRVLFVTEIDGSYRLSILISGLDYVGKIDSFIERDNSTLLVCTYSQRKFMDEMVPVPNKRDTLIFLFGRLCEYNICPSNNTVLSIEFVQEGGFLPYYKYKSFKVGLTGNINYYGGDNVGFYLAGYYKAQMSSQSLASLYKTINYIDFQDQPDSFNLNATDLSTAIITVTYNDGTRKTITDYGESGSYGLRNLYAQFEDIYETASWTEVKK